jgi:hypothetical protein
MYPCLRRTHYERCYQWDADHYERCSTYERRYDGDTTQYHTETAMPAMLLNPNAAYDRDAVRWTMYLCIVSRYL